MRKRVLILFLAAVAVGILNLFSQNMSNAEVTAQALSQKVTPQSVTANVHNKAILDRNKDFDGLLRGKDNGHSVQNVMPGKKTLIKNIELFNTLKEALDNGYGPCKICMKAKNKIITNRYESPCGVLLLGSIGDNLCLCDWQVEKHRNHVDNRLKRILHAEFEEGTSPVIEEAIRQLNEYFAGKRKEFDVPLLFVGTDFQKTVWNELLKIPYAKTISYGEMARNIGMPTAVRAVANANGANAMSIFAPCHRVIGTDRSLTGYGGGLEAKEYLLKLEHPA